MAKKGFLTGLVLGAVAAAAGYVYYKTLPEHEQAELRDKVDDFVGNARDKAVDYTYAAADAAANVRDRADDLVARAQDDFGGTLDDLKNQAAEKAADLKAKATDLKDQLADKVAPDFAGADIDDIVLDPTAPSLSESLSDALDDGEAADAEAPADSDK
jgi:gas vesicle protein